MALRGISARSVFFTMAVRRRKPHINRDGRQSRNVLFRFYRWLVLLPLPDQRHFLFNLVEKLAGLLRTAGHLRAQKDHQLNFARHFVLFLEEPAEAWNIAQPGHFAPDFTLLALD